MRCFNKIDKFQHRIGDAQCNVGGCGLWFPEAPFESLKHPRICKCGGLIHLNLPTEQVGGSARYYDNNGRLVESRYQSLRMCDKCRICRIVLESFKDRSKLN